MGKEFALQHNMHFFEISVKKSKDIKKLFLKMGDCVVENSKSARNLEEEVSGWEYNDPFTQKVNSPRKPNLKVKKHRAQEARYKKMGENLKSQTCKNRCSIF